MSFFFSRYSKAENLTSGSKEMMTFTHLLLEAKSKYSQNLKPYSRTHDILDSVEGFSHIAFNYNTFPPFRIKTKPMIFILKRKEAYGDVKLKDIEKERIELSSGIEELPVDTDILQTDVGENEDILELDETDETSEPLDKISQLPDDTDDNDHIFVRPVTEDNGDEHKESPLIDLNIEPTEDIQEEVQLLKLMRMSREDFIKELNRAENKARIYPKSGTVRRNIKKIIREYKALEDEKQVKVEGSTYADLTPDKEVKHGEHLQEPQFPGVSEESDNEIRAQSEHEYSEQVTKKPVLEKYKETSFQQNTDHAALPPQTETEVSSLLFDNLTHEEHHDTEVERGKKTIKKANKKYKMLDQSTDEKFPMDVDNMTDHVTVQRKKSMQKIRPTKQISKKGVLEQGTEDLDTSREPQEMPLPIQNQTIKEEKKDEVKGGNKNEKITNKIVSEVNKVPLLDNDVAISNGNLENSENGTTENEQSSQTSKQKKRKVGKKLLKDTDEESNVAEMNAAEELQEVPLLDEETPISRIRRKTSVRKIKKEKSKSSDDIQHTVSQPLEHVSNTDDIDKLNAADSYKQENETPHPDDRDIVSEYEIQETSAEKTVPVKNEIEVQESEKVSDILNSDRY